MNKLTTVLIGGKEYSVTDKQANQMIEVLSGKMDELEETLINLRKEMQDFQDEFEMIEL